jgi:hypothetical protein
MAWRRIFFPAFRPVGKMPTGAGETPALPFAICMATPMIHSDPCHPFPIFIPRGAPQAGHDNPRLKKHIEPFSHSPLGQIDNTPASPPCPRFF